MPTGGYWAPAEPLGILTEAGVSKLEVQLNIFGPDGKRLKFTTDLPQGLDPASAIEQLSSSRHEIHVRLQIDGGEIKELKATYVKLRDPRP